MKYCQNCGNVMEDTAVFCGRCGKQADAAVKPTVASGVSNKKPMGIYVYGTLSVLSIVLVLVLLVTAFKNAIEVVTHSNKDIEPTEYSENSVIGDYVNLNIIAATKCYVSYFEYEDGTVEEINTFCLAYDSNGNMVLLKVPCDYYNALLTELPDAIEMYQDGKAPEFPVEHSAVGIVNVIDSELYREKADELPKDIVEIDILEDYLKYNTDDEKSNAFISFITSAIVIAAGYHCILEYRKRKTFFDDHGNYNEIKKQATENCKYSDGVVFTDGYYLLPSSKSADIVRLDEILCMYQKMKVRIVFRFLKVGVINERCFIVINKYGMKLQYKYPASHEERLLNTISVLAPLCPRAVVGYTNENLAYIKNNSVKKRGKAK